MDFSILHKGNHHIGTVGDCAQNSSYTRVDTVSYDQFNMNYFATYPVSGGDNQSTALYLIIAMTPYDL